MDIQSKAKGTLKIMGGPLQGTLTDSLFGDLIIAFPIYTGDVPLMVQITKIEKNGVTNGHVWITGTLVNHPLQPEVSFTYNIGHPGQQTGSIALDPGEYEKLTK